MTQDTIAKMVTFGPWQIPIAVRDCLCPDGIRRRARLTGTADTYFSIPASVTVRGVTISGYVTGTETEDGRTDYQFRTVDGRRNSDYFERTGTRTIDLYGKVITDQGIDITAIVRGALSAGDAADRVPYVREDGSETTVQARPTGL